MIPVDQTRFGDPDGNCLAACLATLLELPLDEVPHFAGEGWQYRLAHWLGAHGLWALRFAPPQPSSLDDAAAWLDETVPGWCIVSGQAPRGLLHATVWQGGELVHDPHPSRDGILDVEDVLVLVPLDPARGGLAQ
jgi:hypothetical protein